MTNPRSIYWNVIHKPCTQQAIYLEDAKARNHVLRCFEKQTLSRPDDSYVCQGQIIVMFVKARDNSDVRLVQSGGWVNKPNGD